MDKQWYTYDAVLRLIDEEETILRGNDTQMAMDETNVLPPAWHASESDETQVVGIESTVRVRRMRIPKWETQMSEIEGCVVGCLTGACVLLWAFLLTLAG